MRVKALDKAKDDWNQLRNHRMEHFGFSVSSEFFQPSPYFWTREGCDVPMMGHYRGASIFFICNGPSLVNGKFDLTLLKRPGIMTYGINNGARTVRPNFWTCVDDPKRFLKSIWFDPCITKVVPHSFAEKRIFDNEKWADLKTVVGECPNVLYFHRNEKFMANRWLWEDTINWGNHKDHGGGRSVMLAALKVMFLMGFRNVFLMGADFKMSETYTYHFDEQRAKGAVNGNNDTYQKLMNQYFPELKPHFEAAGFHVYNCNPESELKVFDHVPYQDAISFASKDVGDVDNERTWGMYSKPDERQKWIAEPDDNSKIHLKTIVNRNKTPVFIDSPINVSVKPTEEKVPTVPTVTAVTAVREVEEIEATDGEVNVFDNKIEDGEVVVPIPISIPMKNHGSNLINPQIQKLQQITKPIEKSTIPITPPLKVENNGNRIIRNVPCGGGISFGSSTANQQNITIEDNGR